jgi:hypothetical protein
VQNTEKNNLRSLLCVYCNVAIPSRLALRVCAMPNHHIKSAPQELIAASCVMALASLLWTLQYLFVRSMGAAVVVFRLVTPPESFVICGSCRRKNIKLLHIECPDTRCTYGCTHGCARAHVEVPAMPANADSKTIVITNGVPARTSVGPRWSYTCIVRNSMQLGVGLGFSLAACLHACA